MAKRPKHYETNESFVRHLMNFSPYGAMSQFVIMAAIDQYTKSVAKATLDQIGPEDGWVNREAWKATAEHIQSELQKFNARD